MKKESLKEKRYTLYGVVVMSSWLGGKGGALLEIETDEKGLEKIKNEPLQDYISYGAENVDYVYFDVYLTEIEITEEYISRKEYQSPIDEITAGETNEKIERIIEHLYENYTEPVKISYGLKRL